MASGIPVRPVLVVGLAPAAHGGNRTGRFFTGDRSGDWLFAAMHRAGYANQALSERRGDGLRLSGAYVTAVNRCPPPQNRPTTAERDNCLPFLERELDLLREARVIVALGSFAWDGVLRAVRAGGGEVPEAEAALRSWCGGDARDGSRCSAATTRASRTPSPAS